MNDTTQKLRCKQLPSASELSNLFRKIAKAAPTCEEASNSLLLFGKALGSAGKQASFDVKITSNASRFEILLAKLFGKRSVGVDCGCTVVCYSFRGKSYITDVIHERS